ncbi:MAG: nuclear transport factor 2 family protein [Terracidiphilus sp.]|jgi:hypothetical protein
MKAALLFFVLSPPAYGATCPSNQARDEATLVHLEEAWAHADEQHDKSPLPCILADEFEEATQTGQLISRSQMLAEPAEGEALHVVLSEMHAHIYDDFAWVRGVSTVRVSNKPPFRNRFTDIFVYREGRWQCVAGHESRYPDSGQ